MSVKRLLNVTSRKKQDNMLSFSNATSAGNNQAVAIGGLFVNGTTPYGMCVYSPTARSMYTASQQNTVIDKADRTAQTCFIRGFAENLRIQTSSPLPWIWRRIVFTCKSTIFTTQNASDTATPKFSPFIDTSVGMGRLWLNLQATGATVTIGQMNTVLFKGTINQDWNDVITAKVDNSRVTLMSDRTCTIRTANSNGHFSERKLWYPCNKNLVYDDDEAGAGETTVYYSTQAKPGMGDMFIADYFVPGVGGTTTDIININSTATMYWHEK